MSRYTCRTCGNPVGLWHFGWKHQTGPHSPPSCSNPEPSERTLDRLCGVWSNQVMTTTHFEDMSNTDLRESYRSYRIDAERDREHTGYNVRAIKRIEGIARQRGLIL